MWSTKLTATQHSLVFVADNHSVWMPERSRKIRKKYGMLVQSPFENLNEMLVEHQDRVFDVMDQQTRPWQEQRAAKAPRQAQNAMAMALNGGSGLGLSNMRLPAAQRH